MIDLISKLLRSSFASIFCVAILLNSSWSRADLQVFPTRIFLTDQKKTAHISLRHLGSSPGRYRVSAVFYRMHTDGRMEMITQPEPGENSAVKIVRFSPREVTLPPRVEQILRIMIYSESRLEEGDYRAHLYFEPADEDSTSGPRKSTGALSMQLQAKIAVAVPVVFRHGSPLTKAKLENLTLIKQPDGAFAFSAMLNREGKGFLYGDFHLLFTPKGGESREIGFVAGVSSYIDKRKVLYPISDAGSFGPGVLRLEYRENDGDSSQTIALTETEIK